MSDYRRLRVEGGCYFFTVNLQDRQLRLLTEHVDLLRASVAQVQRRSPFRIDAMVVLPDHLHSLWTLPRGDENYSTRWNQIKGEFSRALPHEELVSRSRSRRRERGIWQRRFWEHAIRSDDDYTAHVDYIHYNPVKHGHVSRPADWPYSSIHRYIRDGAFSADWGTVPPADHDWS